MKKRPICIAFLCFLAFSLTGCWTRILTVAPTTAPVAPVKTVYTTQVTTPAPKHTVTTTVTVTSFNEDISFYLDLHAVGAAFAESENVAEFEQLLNSSRYMINNLDLNRDGWIDYLRVIETRQGLYHVFLIQACLAPSVFQDVATLIAERRADVLYVEIIGDRYLYGPNYIVRPVFIKRPPLWTAFGRPAYNPWSSPYYYGYWPAYYQKPKPIYLSHYQSYVKTYISHHHYCHSCEYPSQPFFNGYTQMTQPHARNDYQSSHPNDSFERRVTQKLSSGGSGVSVRNAGQLRTETQRAANAASQEQPKTSTASSNTSVRQSSTTTSTPTRQGSTTTSSSVRQQPSTSVESRVSSKGTTRTTIRTTDDTGKTTTVKRTATTTTRSTTPATRTTTTTTRSSSTGSGSTRSAKPATNEQKNARTATSTGSKATRR